MKSGRRSFGAGIQASGHEPQNSQLRKLPNPRNRMLSEPIAQARHTVAEKTLAFSPFFLPPKWKWKPTLILNAFRCRPPTF